MNYAARSLRLRIPRICVSITATDASDLLDKAETVLRENALIELRLDHLKAPLTAMARLRRLTEVRPDAVIIATCRRTIAGGKFQGTAADELGILRKAAEAGCQAVDVELETAEAVSAEEWEGLRALTAIVLSHHNFKATTKLEETFERMRAFTADFYKVVGTANSLHDNVVMTRFLEHHSSEYPMVGMCMGEQGMLSRVLGIRAGGLFTFGSAEHGKETAPGQPTFRELRDFYRIEQIDSVTKVYGIAGNPVTHSMSPWVQNAAFRRENVNAVYLPLQASTVEDLMATIHGLPLDGLSVTMPYKQAVAEHLDNSDVLTQRTGACNTIVRGKDGRLFGFNTDVYGIVAAIEPRVPLKDAKVLVLGAGGAARAAVFGFRAKGAEVSILNRTAATAVELAKQSGSKVIKRSELAKSAFDIIFNATPVGMGADKSTPLAENEMHTHWLFDSVYNPLETNLIKLAQSKGIGTISGAEMFVHQAARQFEIWTGKPAPIDSIRQVLLRQLGATGNDSAPIPTVVPPKTKAAAAVVAPVVEAAAVAEPKVESKPTAAPAKNAKSSEPKVAAKGAPEPKPAKAEPKVETKPAAKAVKASPAPAKSATKASATKDSKVESKKAESKPTASESKAKPVSKAAKPAPAKASPVKVEKKPAAKPAPKASMKAKPAAKAPAQVAKKAAPPARKAAKPTKGKK